MRLVGGDQDAEFEVVANDDVRTINVKQGTFSGSRRSAANGSDANDGFKTGDILAIQTDANGANDGTSLATARVAATRPDSMALRLSSMIQLADLSAMLRTAHSRSVRLLSQLPPPMGSITSVSETTCSVMVLHRELASPRRRTLRPSLSHAAQAQGSDIALSFRHFAMRPT